MKGIRFRPEQSGLRAALFDLEADIMEIVWAKGYVAFPVADVHKQLGQSREIAYTTVMTTVSRLYDKGLLTRQREGRRYLYTPAMSRAAFSEAIAKELLQGFSGLSHEHAMALLVDEVADSDLGELKKLEALIRRRKKELSK